MKTLEQCPQGHIFVFGSNLMGVHGRGAARTARTVYGATLGIGSGRTGRAYAIPTKDRKLQPLPLNDIERHVLRFIAFAADHSDTAFYVTPIGTGLAGYTHAEIAPLFKSAPDNCYFIEDWRPYLVGTRT